MALHGRRGQVRPDAARGVRARRRRRRAARRRPAVGDQAAAGRGVAGVAHASSPAAGPARGGSRATSSRWVRSHATVAKVKPCAEALRGRRRRAACGCPPRCPPPRRPPRTRTSAASNSSSHRRVAGERPAHRDAQVGRADVEAVEAGRGRDRLDVRQPLGRLDHREDDGRARSRRPGTGPDAQARAHRPVRPDRRAAGTSRSRRRPAASSAVSTSGTMTPAAPASSALPIGVGSFASTRTRPTEVWPGVDGDQARQHARVADQAVLERRGRRSRSRGGRCARSTGGESRMTQ